MSYGVAAYGSTAIGGQGGSQWYIFFPFPTGGAYAPDVLHESRLELSEVDGLFSLFVIQSNESGDGILYRAYTSNDPGETPQLQVSFAGIGSTVIGAAQFIRVTAVIDSTIWPGGIQFSIRGRRGT